MGVLESIARLYYESKKFNLKREKEHISEEPKRIYKIDINKIVQNQKFRSAGDDIHRYALEYIRLNDQGFSYEDIKRMLRLTDNDMKIIMEIMPKC